jgi:hypothetical protein
MRPSSWSQVGRLILFVAALGILVYEFILAPSRGKEPDPTIVIAAIGLAAACISLKWDLKG